MARLALAAAAVALALLLWPVLASAGTTISPTAPPTVSTPTPLIDNTVTASPGTWPGSPTFSYQWYDCDADPSDPNDCIPIAGATSATYKVAPDDGGDLLAVGVSATEGSSTGSAMSAPTQAVAARTNAPAVVPGDDPTVTGGAVGSAATGTTGTWSSAPAYGNVTYTDQWYSCAPDGSGCQAIAGANGLSYTPTSADLGQVLVLEVYATNTAGDSVPDNSDPSSVIGGANPTITVTAPAEGATFAEGAQVTAQFSCATFDGSAPIECDATDDIGNSIVPGGSIDTGVPGSHTLTITAIDQYGSVASTTIDYAVTAGGTGSSQQPHTPSSGTPAGTLSLTDLRQSAKVWRLRAAKATPAGTSFSFVASAPSLVTYTFSRLVGGRMVAGACVAGTRAERSRPRCTRTVLDGSISLDATAGPNRHSFDGRLAGGGRLVPGRYAVTVRARAIGAASGAAVVTAGTLHFTVVK